MNKKGMGYILGDVPKIVIDLPKDEGTKNAKIAQILKDIVLKSRESRVVRLFALKILKEAGIRPKDYLGELEAIHNWVRDNITYRKDPAFLDTFHEAERTIKDFLYNDGTSGDCDDHAVLVASLLISIGHVPRLVMTNSMPGGKYTHIYTEVLYQGKWLCLETTEPVSAFWCPPSFKKGIVTIIDKKEQT